MNELRIIVSGSRGFSDYEFIKKELDSRIKDIVVERFLLHDEVQIVTGGAKGVDALAERYADTNEFNQQIFYAIWKTHGKSAGFIRNANMLSYAVNNGIENAALIAFWDGKSKGTKHMIDIATKKGIEVQTILI